MEPGKGWRGLETRLLVRVASGAVPRKWRSGFQGVDGGVQVLWHGWIK